MKDSGPTLVPHELIVPGNVASLSAIIGTLIGWLPHVAALLAVIWYCILIYDRFKRPKKSD